MNQVSSITETPVRMQIIMVSIVALALLLRVIFFSGFVSGDDAAYVARAYANAAFGFDAPYSHWGARAGVVLPTTIAYMILGVSELSTVLTPFLLSILGVYAAYSLGKLLYSQETGLMAAFLMAIFPMEVLFASQLFPYTFLSCFLGWAGFYFIRAIKSENWCDFLFSGVLLGLAYTSRITALYLLLFFALVWFFRRYSIKGMLYIALGLLVVVIAESLYYWIVTGDPLARYDILLGKTVGGVSHSSIRGLTLQWWLEPIVRPFFEPEFGFMPLVGIIACGYFAFKKRDSNSLILLIWIISMFLYVSYGTTSPTGYSPLRHLPRYLSIIIVPIMVISGAWIATRKEFTQRVLCAFLLVSSIGMLLIDSSDMVTERERRIAKFIQENELTEISLSRTIHFDTMFYLGFKHPSADMLVKVSDASDGRLRSRIVAPALQELHELSLAKTGAVFHDPRYRVSSGSDDIPSSWNLVESFYNAETFKGRLLQNAVVMKVLSLVRDKSRMKSLSKDSKKKRIDVYSAVP